MAEGTYADRYDSADVIEYAQRATRRSDRYVDLALSKLGAGRRRARDRYRATVSGQQYWDPAFVVGHNAVQLIPSVDPRRHIPVLYAHNDLLRTYSAREASEALSPVSVIVAVSAYLADRLQSALPRELRDRVEVVVNGVDARAFTAPPRESHGTLEVVLLSRMVPDKGAAVLIDALTLLDRQDIHATLIGSEGFDPRSVPSDYERRLRHAAAPLASRIEFLPFQSRPRVAELLAKADVVVVPSRWPDPCPLTVLEGMASGAAVIGSDIGGIPQACGGAGILVAPGDARALAAALAALADDEQLLRELQRAGVARARARDWSIVAEELDAVLRPRA